MISNNDLFSCEILFKSKGRAQMEGSYYFILVDENDSDSFKDDLWNFNKIEEVNGFLIIKKVCLSFLCYFRRFQNFLNEIL